MTKVLPNWLIWVAVMWLVCPTASETTETLPNKPAESLYLQLGHVGLDPARVYQVRGASLNRSGIQISLDDGTIGFTQDVMGHVTGAFFEGDGEILLSPPNEVERRSMGLFTGMAILEERFETAYFRFNDDAAAELRPDLRATDKKQEFLDRWDPTARNLASADAMRLLMTFSQMLPVDGSPMIAGESSAEHTSSPPDHFFHARLHGTKLGVFDVYYDSTAAEQVQVGQARTADNGEVYYDVWTSFSPSLSKLSWESRDEMPQPPNEQANHKDRIAILRYTITTEVMPPRQIHARARLQCEIREGGTRTLLFELARILQVESVKFDGQPVEFIHNPSLEGTQLARQGNDLVAVVLPEPTKTGQRIELEFVYGGDVLAEAGNGLLYVGARGTWYPNRGIEMANFDLQFTYPQGWILVATGKPTSISPGRSDQGSGEQTSRWVSDRPIPLAGFNLGKYKVATLHVGNVSVETYATQGVEREFPTPRIQVIDPNPPNPSIPHRPPEIIVPSRPSPAQTEATVGDAAAQAIRYFAQRFGAFPYGQLALTQMPGRDSQGWPGLVFLSSFAFLTNTQREQMHFEPFRILLQQSIPAHEVAHQWWGDLITWSSYRDQWFSEGLANYCALMMLQEKNPAGFREIMQKYRDDLITKNKDGMAPMNAGPVTLSGRLLSSHFPGGYESISYGRGTWLFHMLRTMLQDAEQKKGHAPAADGDSDEPFVRALRRVRQRYEGKAISTRELLDVFAEGLPPSLRFEGKNSLDWFMDTWINGTSVPKLELKAVRFTPKRAASIVAGTILQKEAPDDLVTSVPVYAVFAGRPPVLLGRVFADGLESSFRLSAPKGTRKIVLDPYDTVLTRSK